MRDSTKYGLAAITTAVIYAGFPPHYAAWLVVTCALTIIAIIARCVEDM